jgi:hypothetical protein
MKLPWTKDPYVAAPHPPMISDEEMVAREAAWQANLKDRAERTARIPENLVGYRLSRGCTCGAEEKAQSVWGDMRPSMGISHKDDCEAMRALFVQVIEVDSPARSIPLAPFCYICGVAQTEEHAALPHGEYGIAWDRVPVRKTCDTTRNTHHFNRGVRCDCGAMTKAGGG